jgi:hypothetical protein
MKLKQIESTEITTRLNDGQILYCEHKDYDGEDVEIFSSQYCMVETRDWEKIFLFKPDNESRWEQIERIQLIKLIDRCWYVDPNAIN